MLRTTLSVKLGAKPARIVTGAPDIEIRDWVYTHDITSEALGLDTETTGLDVFSDSWACRLVQIADGSVSYLMEVDQAKRILPMMDGRNVICWNAPYDMSVLWKATGIDYSKVLNVWDGSVMVREVEPRTAISSHDQSLQWLRLSGGLKDTAQRWGMPELAEAEKELREVGKDLGLIPRVTARDIGGIFQNIPLDHPSFVRYAGLDPIAAYRLGHHFINLLNQNPHQLRAVILNTEVTMSMFRASYRGMAVDQEALQTAVQASDEVERRNLVVLKRHGLESPSGPKVAQAFIDRGIESFKRTPKGKPSFDKHVLATLAEDGDELAEAILELRKSQKYRAAYLAPMEQTTDGFVHPSFRVPGTLTGRMSASNPPVQQFPKGQGVRKLLRARDGHVLVGADFDQLEARVAAVVTHDEVLRDAILQGIDVHHETAETVFGKGYDPELRKTAKAGFFAWLYGSGSRTLANTLGITEQTAQELIDALSDRFWRVALAADSLGRNEAIYTLMGRRVPLLDRWEDQEGKSLKPSSHKALNYLVQGSAADITAMAILEYESHSQDMSGGLWLALHDEIIVEVPSVDAEAAAERLENAMRMNIDGIPITATAEVIGEVWDR